MKKNLFLLIFAAILLSCTNKENQIDSSVATLDLDNFNYSDVSSLLSTLNGSQNVTVTEEGQTFQVVLSSSSDIVTGEDIQLYTGRADDSISLALSPEYATASIHVNGELLNFVDYKSATQMSEITAFYNEQLSSTTRSASNSITRSATSSGLKLNISEIEKNAPEAHACESATLTEEQQAEIEAAKNVSTRSSTPRNGIVTVYVLKESGSNPLAHEIIWQVNNASSSIRNVNSSVTFNFIIENCSYSGGNVALTSLTGFRNWVQNSSKYKGNVGDIFFLVRWGGWNSSILGLAYVNTYDIGRSNNSSAYGVSCTTCLYPTTLSHEMGHIFGAVHVSSLFDLMHSTYTWLGGNIHKNSTNRNTVYYNCQ
jgi:fragilysin